MTHKSIDLIITAGILLIEIVMAYGFMLKQHYLYKKNCDPTKIVNLPKIPKTAGQKLKERLYKEKAFEKLLELG